MSVAPYILMVQEMFWYDKRILFSYCSVVEAILYVLNDVVEIHL